MKISLSCYAWYYNNNEGAWLLSHTELHQSIAAFTVAELGMMLPDGNQLRGENNIAQFNTFRHIRNNKWSCCADYSSPRMSTEYGDVYEVWKEFEGNTQAECMAEMLIYIIEGSLIDVDKINARI